MLRASFWDRTAKVVVPQDPMPLPQQIGDLEFGRTGAGLITCFDADETEADAIGGIASRQPRHHRAEGDVSILILVAAEHGPFGRHHADNLERLAPDADLLPQSVAGGEEFQAQIRGRSPRHCVRLCCPLR